MLDWFKIEPGLWIYGEIEIQSLKEKELLKQSLTSSQHQILIWKIV